MGKKGSWIAAVKRVFIYEQKGKADQTRKSKKWLEKRKDSYVVPSSEETKVVIPQPSPHVEDENSNGAGKGQTKHAYTVALATAKAAEAAVAAAQAAAEVVRLATFTFYSGKSRDEIAATKIQTAFRGYSARRALRTLRGSERLKTLVQGPSIKRQAASTLRCMQTLAHVQSQIRSRRIRMSEENRALQQQLQQKREKELEKLKASMGEEWDDSTRSKEQIEARLKRKQEAAIRRERALAYAYSHQQMWKKSSKSANPTFMDPNNPHWGWSWLERWMAARPWEAQSATDSSYHVSLKSTTNHKHNGKHSPSFRRLSLPSNRQSPSSSVNMKIRSASLSKIGSGANDDSWSLRSVQSKHYRRHSIGESFVLDDVSLASSPSVPGYMTPTKATKARSRLPSPLGIGTLAKVSMGSAKKRLSFSASTIGKKRHSRSVKDTDVKMEDNL